MNGQRAEILRLKGAAECEDDVPDVRRAPTPSDTGAAIRPVRRGHQRKRVMFPRFRAQCANHGSGLVLRDHPLRSLRSGVGRQQILAEARPFSISYFAFDLVITHRTPIQRFWPIRIAGQLRSRPSRRQLLSLLPVEFVEAPTYSQARYSGLTRSSAELSNTVA